MRVIPDGEAMRRRREARGLSMDDLARRTKVSKNTIWRIETGQVTYSYGHTMGAIAKALGCDRNEILRASPVSAPRAPDPEEVDLPPEDFEELPDPAGAPPEPLGPRTMQYIASAYRALEGKRFTFEARVDAIRYLHIQERIAINCIPAGLGLCFDTTVLTDGIAARVPVYTTREDMKEALLEAIDFERRMRFVVKVLVVESTSEYGTIPDSISVPPSAFVKWKGFSWAMPPEPRRMWCFLATDVARAEGDAP